MSIFIVTYNIQSVAHSARGKMWTLAVQNSDDFIYIWCIFFIWTSRKMHYFQRYFSRIFRDFSGPRVFKKKSRTFQEAWGTLLIAVFQVTRWCWWHERWCWWLMMWHIIPLSEGNVSMNSSKLGCSWIKPGWMMSEKPIWAVPQTDNVIIINDELKLNSKRIRCHDKDIPGHPDARNIPRPTTSGPHGCHLPPTAA